MLHLNVRGKIVLLTEWFTTVFTGEFDALMFGFDMISKVDLLCSLVFTLITSMLLMVMVQFDMSHQVQLRGGSVGASATVKPGMLPLNVHFK